jgi:hypothetical protein
MLVIWSALFGVLFFFAIVVVTLILGAAGNRASREIIARTEAERRAGLTGDVTSDTPHPIHDRYLEA